MEKAIVVGCGRWCDENIEQISRQYEILEFVDSYKKYYNGKPVVGFHQIKEIEYEKIIVAVVDMKNILEIVKRMVEELSVDAQKIIIGCSLDLENEYKLKVAENGNVICSFDNIEIEVSSVDEFNNIKEIYLNRTYQFFYANSKKTIVFDIGMNIGGASCFFANSAMVEKVYSFEPFPKTCELAKRNVKANKFEKKIEVCEYGLGDKEEIKMLSYNKNMSCGLSTNDDVSKKMFQLYDDWRLIDEKETEHVEVKIRKASDVFAPLIEQYKLNYNLCIKIDCEGGEEEILTNFVEQDLLKEFSIVMLEWHMDKKKRILEILEKEGFSYFCYDKNENMGLVNAMRYS